MASCTSGKLARRHWRAARKACFGHAWDFSCSRPSRGTERSESTGMMRADRAGLRIVFAVGPEGGWNDAERAMLERRGALPLRLGGRVLRAETAVPAGPTLLQHAYGDM